MRCYVVPIGFCSTSVSESKTLQKNQITALLKNMSQKLQQLIRNVRACKTAADERGVIAKESALIRTAFKEENNE